MSRYDAFISYKHEDEDDGREDDGLAAAVQRALQRLAKPWYRRRAMHVYRDRTAMAASPDLWGTIRAALDESRWFVLLASPSAAKSTWIDREIRYWVETHPDPEDRRLLVVLIAGGWAWDRDTGDFDWEDSSALPRALSGAFAGEPFILSLLPGQDFDNADLGDPRFRDVMASLAAAIHEDEGKTKEEIEADDLGAHRRTMRVLWGAASGFAVLALVASAAGVSAVANAAQARAQRADAQRSETQAQAQADAAEAVLAASDSPALAIDLALRAAERSDRPSVRSAMLAVSQDARRLVTALVYPEGEAGHPAEAAAFSLDGTRLMAWGAGPDDGRSHLQVWRLDRLTTVFSGPVDVAGLEQVVALDDTSVAACTDRGPALIGVDGPEATVEVLDPGWEAPRICSTLEFAGGVVFRQPGQSPGPPGTRVLYLDRRGNAQPFDDVTSVVTHFQSRQALLAGPTGITVVRPEGVQEVSTAPIAPEGVGIGDATGRFFVPLDGARWAMVEPGAGGHRLRELALPAGTVAAAPVIDYEHLTPDVAWLTADGAFGWTEDAQTVTIASALGEATLTPDRVHLEPLSGSRFVVITPGRAVVLDPPTLPQIAEENGRPAGWAPTPVDAAVGPRAARASEAVVASCANRHQVVLDTDGPAIGELLIGEPTATPTSLQGAGRLAPDCKVVEVGASLGAMGRFGGMTLVRGTYVADALAVSPSTDALVVVRAGRPLEVLSTAPEDELARPWVLQGNPVDPSPPGPRPAELLPEGTTQVAARPDGQGSVTEVDGRRVFVAADGSTTPVDAACRDRTITYVPRAGFEDDSDAAQAQLPVVQSASDSAVDCRDGSPLDLGLARLEVLSYEVESDHGRLVTRRPGHPPAVTVWRPGRRGGPRTVEGPAVSDLTLYRFDEEGGRVATREPNSRAITVHRRDGDHWEVEATVASGLERVVDVALVDRGTLLLVVDRSGGFELFDPQTGRRVAYDLAPEEGAPVIDGIASSRVVDGHLYTNLNAAYSGTEPPTEIVAGLDIPVGIDVLAAQLCRLYDAASCPP